jgi:hypothetical protein
MPGITACIDGLAAAAARRVRESVRILLTLLLAGWGVVALLRDLTGMVTARGPTAVEEPAPIALARCEGSLAEARGQRARSPGDALACLRVATLELRRAELLSLVSYEKMHGPDWSHVLRPAPDAARARALDLLDEENRGR